MTPNEFRELALSFPDAIESAHMHHPDFRVGGKIFATLGYPDKDPAMVKLSPDEQKELSELVQAFSNRRKAPGAGREVQLFTCRRQRSTSFAERSQQRGATPRRSGYRKIANA